MQYKALMLDVDGTIIPYEYDSFPSTKVLTSIQKAREKNIHVCLVTGRSYLSTKKILDYLGIGKGLTVVDGGAYVYDVSTNTPLHEQHIKNSDLNLMIKVFGKENTPFYIKDKQNSLRKGTSYVPYSGQKLSKVSMIFTDEVFTLSKTHEILKKLSSPSLSVLRTMHKTPNMFSFNITHAKATKLHGIEILQKKLGLKREEIIGVGDGYNDFPLLMASGLKIAMGNAIQDLKEIADYIAPTVDNDGVAKVIDRYIINSR